MSQDNVERLLGRLITDREFLASCRDSSLEAALLEWGYLVTDLELSAIKNTDLQQFASLTPCLDDRLKRAGNGRIQGGMK